MNLYENELYVEDVRSVACLDLPWNELQNKSVLVSGATGLIGSFFIDVILHKNAESHLNCTVYALGRDTKKMTTRFVKYIHDDHLFFVQKDIQTPLYEVNIEKVDYVLHLASNTHPYLYSTDPVGTVLTNIFGLKNMLDFAVKHNANKFLFASSNEVYGENRGDVELFKEEYSGYINCNTLRAGYPESKRCGEALCQAYRVQHNLETVVARFTRTYGPTMLINDTKAISQFIKNAVLGEDIILKSQGTQYYSYTYVADAVSGLLSVLLMGKSGEAYNISDETGDIKLRDLAQIVAEVNGKSVVFETPDVVEAAGYSTATKARLDGSKLHSLGWKAHYDIKTGVERTISILKSQM